MGEPTQTKPPHTSHIQSHGLNDNSITFDTVIESDPLSITTDLQQSPLINNIYMMSQEVVGPDPFSEPNKVLVDKLCTMIGALIEATHFEPPVRVVNLSSRQVTSAELALLGKGINFCPTSGEPKMGDLVNDLDYFHENLRWQYHFLDTPQSVDPFDKLVMTSSVLKKSSTPPLPLPIKT